MTDGRVTGRSAANSVAAQRMAQADPVLVDVRPALAALPGMQPHMILTSGAPMPWSAYTGGQRRAIVGAAQYEGLASSAQDADDRIAAGDILLRACHDHGCVGSVTGVTSASMPVLVVEDRNSGTCGHCLVYEGPARQRLTYGVWNDAVRDQLLHVRDVIGPALGAAVRAIGGLALNPIMRRALGMGDDLHSRNVAATSLFYQRMAVPLLTTPGSSDVALEVLRFLEKSELFFLHVGMASGKATADAARDVAGSSIVTAMVVSEREFAIRVGGTGDTWFRAPLPPLEAKLFEGFTPDDLAFMGGESLIMETIGLGGMAAAAAFSLQDYSGGTPAAMIATNEQMYTITETEHPEFKIPFLGFRGTPLGIDVAKVVATGVTPAIHMGAAHRDGGHIGAGLLRAPLEPFQEAVAALHAAVS
jgi:hypothetical protein